MKIVFFDIDGTLMDPDTGRISEKTALAVTGLRENGIKVCVATGNAAEQVKAIADEICLPVSGDGIYHDCVSHGWI